MENEFQNIESKLQAVRPSTLSLEQKEALWSRVQSRLNEAPVESPYMIFSMVTHVRVLVPALLVVFIVSTGATTALADGARPGDFLFAVDRAAERVRLSIVSESKKDDVRVAIADERVEELESLVSEESTRRFARAENTRNAKQAPAPQAEMALFATNVAMDADVAVEGGSDDSVRSPENPRFEDDMIQTQEFVVVDEVADEEVVGPGPEDIEVSDKRQKDIETALMLIGTISVELEEKGNAEGHARVEEALNRLTEKVSGLPAPEKDGELREVIEDFLPSKREQDYFLNFDWDAYESNELFKSTAKFEGQNLQSIAIEDSRNKTPNTSITVEFSGGTEELFIEQYPPTDGLGYVWISALAKRYSLPEKDIVSALSIDGDTEPKSPYTGETYKKEYGVEVEGEVRGESIEIEENEIPRIDISRPKKNH